MANEAAGVTYPSNSNIAYSTGTPRMSTRFKSVLFTPSSWGLKSQTDARPPLVDSRACFHEAAGQQVRQQAPDELHRTETSL